MTFQEEITRSEERIRTPRREAAPGVRPTPTTEAVPTTPHPIDVAVGRRIRTLRLRLGFTQQQLAEKIGVKFQQLQKYETAVNRVSASRIALIAEALDVTVLDIFDLSGQQTQPSEAVSHEADALIRSYLALPTYQRAIIKRLADDLREHQQPGEPV